MFQCPAVDVLNFILSIIVVSYFGMSGVICDIFRSLSVITELFSLIPSITNILVLTFSPSPSFLGLCIATQPLADLVT